jgi:hypothetical protein
MGNLFYRGVRPVEIAQMSYEELRYWNGWHEVFKAAEVRALEAARGR